jgi:hypothetical protein
MTRRRDPQGRLVSLCEVADCYVAAIGLGRCVRHVAPLISVAAKANAPAVAGPGRSEGASGVKRKADSHGR